MKGYIGAFLIYFSYIFSGLLMDTWPLKYAEDQYYKSGIYIFVICNLILLILLFIGAKIVNRFKSVPGLIVLLVWITLSTVYGLTRMNQDFILSTSENWNKFWGWDYALWELGTLLYIGVPQVVFIVGYLLMRVFINDYINKER